MQLRTGAKRHGLWSKESLLEDVGKYGSAKRVCQMYGGEEHWRTYYNDIWRWRRSDAEFERRYRALVKPRGAEGRPRLDGGDKGWFDDFFAALESCYLDETEAIAKSGCPYSERQLREFRSRSSSSYDKEYHERWETVRLRVVNAGKGEAARLLEPVEIPTEYDAKAIELALTKAKIQQMRANTLTKILQSLDKEEWGRELHMKGTVDFRHQLEARYRPREELLLALAEERKQFEVRQSVPLELPSGDDVVDAEVVSEEAESVE